MSDEPKVTKYRVVEDYSFRRIETLLGLQHDSIRTIEIDNINEIVSILHSDKNNGAEEHLSGYHIMHKNRG